MNSQHYALATAVTALYTAAPALASGNVHQSRSFSLPGDHSAQIHVNLGDTAPVVPEVLGGPVDWNTDIVIVIKARATASKSAEALADEVWAQVYARVMAAPTLGGLVDMLTPGEAYFDDDEAEVGVARITWRFKVQHRTDSKAIT